VTHLRQLMLEELRRRNYSAATIRAYISTVNHFSRHFHRSPDQPGLEALGRGKSDICKLGRIYVDFGLANPDAYRLAFMVEKPDPVHAIGGDPMLAAGLNAFNLLREAVGLTVGAGLPPQELELTAQSLWAALHGLVSLLLARPNFPWKKQSRLIEFHVARACAQAVSETSRGGTVKAKR